MKYNFCISGFNSTYFFQELLASKSAKIAALLKENPQENINTLLQDFSADPETFELVARFCHGFELTLSSEKVIPLICLAYRLEMTENYCKNNLIKIAVTFFEQNVLPNWNETIKALRSAGRMIPEAARLGLFDACLESLVTEVEANPRLLGDPIKNPRFDEDSGDEEKGYRPNARRKLYFIDWKSEDLCTLSLKIYHPIIHAMNQRGIPPEYVAASLCRYAEKWIYSNGIGGEDVSMYKRKSQRDTIEAIERLLPNEKGLIPCTLLFKMLRFAILLESSNDCRNGFEIRIGKQLEQATVKDLLIPSQGYAKQMQYDVECVKRIVKHFYENCSGSDCFGLIAVAELIEEFLVEIASDIDLEIDTFIAFAEMSIAASETRKISDGIYQAIDIFLDKHRHLTDNERYEVCKMLDCYKMSPEALEHAAKNERLPVRFLVQVLFVGQLQLRDTVIGKEVQISEKLNREEVDEEEKSEAKVNNKEMELEKVNNKVMELEKECCRMRKQIESCCSDHKMKKGKISMWKEMKRKFGCSSSIHDCNCQVKKKNKVNPK